MPEKITKEEAKVEQAIRALRKAKELLQEEGRNTLPYDADEAKEMKIKTPKADKADKITNETQDKEGFGLAGEENVGKATYGSRWRKNEGKATDSKEHMIEEIRHHWESIDANLDENVTKESMADLIGLLTNFDLQMEDDEETQKDIDNLFS